MDKKFKRLLVLYFRRTMDYLYLLSIALIAGFVLEILKAESIYPIIGVVVGALVICALTAIADNTKGEG